MLFPSRDSTVLDRTWNSPYQAAAMTRAAWVAYGLLALIALNLFDLSLSVLAQRSRVLTADTEQNPIAAQLLADDAASLSSFKLGLVALGVTGLFLCRKAPVARVAVAGLLGVYVMVALNWVGCAAAIALDLYRMGGVRLMQLCLAT